MWEDSSAGCLKYEQLYVKRISLEDENEYFFSFFSFTCNKGFSSSFDVRGNLDKGPFFILRGYPGKEETKLMMKLSLDPNLKM